MAPHIKPKKNSLAIRLTESAVFLRTDYTPTRRNVQPTSSTRNGLLRGLLVLEIVKPTKITSIDVELTGTSSTAWPEGVGSRRMDVTEEHKIFHASTTYFRACPSVHSSSSSSTQRRTASIGPGVSYSHSQRVLHDIENEEIEDDEDSQEGGLEDVAGGSTAANGILSIRATSPGGSNLDANDQSSSIVGTTSQISPRPSFRRNPSRRVSIDGSQLSRPQFYESYPGELAPIPPYSALPPSSPNLGRDTSDARRISLVEPIPEDELEAAFDHHGLLRQHHEEEEEEEEVGLRVDHEVAPLESPRPPAVIPSLLEAAAVAAAGIASTSPISMAPKLQGISTTLPLGPLPTTSISSVASSSSSGSQHLDSARARYAPPSPNPSLAMPPLSTSAISTSSLHANMQQNRTPNSPLPSPSIPQQTPSYIRSDRNSPTSTSQHFGISRRHRSPSVEPANSGDQRGRSKRFSLTAVSNMFKDAVRSGSPRRSFFGGHGGSHPQPHEGEAPSDPRRSIDTSGGRTSMDGPRRQRSTDARSPASGDRRGRTSERLSEMYGNESALVVEEEDEDEDKERGRSMFGKILMGGSANNGDKEKEGWKEFKKGTYTYPISFSIPSNAPPSMQCDYGSVSWRLNANVHRPGTFKSRMTATRDVIIISCPTEEDTEDTENIIVERHWEQQLQYLISVSGRSFYVGGTMPVSLTLMPLAKVKIHRLSVILEEKVDYFTNMRRVVRSDDPIKFVLLSIRREGKATQPILPLESDGVEVLRDSPLMGLFDADKDDLGEVASNLMGPGPWSFHKDLKLPSSCDILRFTNRNKRANMQVTHMLKVVMRVERSDDVHLDKNGKRKLFDIVVQTPVLILSCRCNPEWSSLPRYTAVFDNVSDITPSCPCHTHGLNQHHHLERSGSQYSSDDSIASTAETTPIPPLSFRSLRNPNFSESLLRQSSLFERLVSGQESETGEAPPAYSFHSASPVAIPSRSVMVAG